MAKLNVVCRPSRKECQGTNRGDVGPARSSDRVPVRLCSVGCRLLLTSRISALRFRNPAFRLW